MKLSIADMEAVIAVYETQNYTAASERLFISQAALRKRLAKVTVELGPLFSNRKLHKEDGAVLPLPPTKQLVKELKAHLGDLETTLRSFRNAPPEEIEATIRIGVIENLEHILMPDIELAIREKNTHIEFRSYGLTRNQLAFRAQDPNFAFQQLYRAETDLCIFLKPTNAGKDPFINFEMNKVSGGIKVHVQKLFSTAPVGIVHASVEVPSPPTLDFIESSKIVVLSKDYLRIITGQERVHWEVQSIHTVVDMVAKHPGYISIPPRIVAESLAQYLPIKIFELPTPTPNLNMDVMMAWTDRTNADPLHRWVREEVINLTKKYDI